MKLLISFLIVLKLVTCDNNFRSMPMTLRTPENETILLPCYHNTPYFSVRWFRDEVLLADSQDKERTLPDRLTLWGNGSLELTQIRLSDSGDYSCQIQTEGGLAEQVHTIEVQIPPAIILSPESGIIEVPVGGRADISCEATGVPTPVITWKCKGQEMELIDSRPRLSFEVTGPDLEGDYECTADNGVGPSASATVMLRVLTFPRLTSPSRSVHTRAGLRAQLECTATSRPAPNIHWFRSGHPLTTSAGRVSRIDQELPPSDEQEASEMSPEITRRSVLLIRNVRDSDLGLYECRAENKIGVQLLHLELTGVPLPAVFKTGPLPTLPDDATPPSSFNQVSLPPGRTRDSAYTLVWQTESLSPIVEYKLQFRTILTGDVTDPSQKETSDWTSLTIPGDMSNAPVHTAGYSLRGLMPGTLYEATVDSRNRYGWSTSRPMLKFTIWGNPLLDPFATRVSVTDMNSNSLYVGPEESRQTSSSGRLIPQVCIMIITIFFRYLYH